MLQDNTPALDADAADQLKIATMRGTIKTLIKTDISMVGPEDLDTHSANTVVGYSGRHVQDASKSRVEHLTTLLILTIQPNVESLE